MSKITNIASTWGGQVRRWFGLLPVAPTQPVAKTLVLNDYSTTFQVRHQLKIHEDHKLWREMSTSLWDKFTDAKMAYLGDIWVDADNPDRPRYDALYRAWQNDFIRLEQKFSRENRHIPSNWWPHG